jgi:diguanylate cyclase (GGDEF)-like protein
VLDNDGIAKEEQRAFRIFLGSLTVVILSLIAGIFIGVAFRSGSLIQDIILARGRSLFQQIVLTRRWAAQYGGVYVRKGPGVESNPWLEHPDIEAADGSLLTLRNPALITREISEIAEKQKEYRFKITSLRPINPGNAPDDFERGALESFETGVAETWATVDSPEGREFRYMGALKTEASCLVCHASQGYKVGDIRGGISVGFPIGTVERELRKNTIALVAAAVLISLLTLGTVFAFVLRLRKELSKVRAALSYAATTDALTGIFNRRFIMERFAQETDKALRTDMDLTCAILDADHFKSLNDQEGHQAGDRALQAIAAAMDETVRAYDIAGRYGGEEFIILFPGIDGEEAFQACERLRTIIVERTAAVLPRGRSVTVSMGIANLRCLEPSLLSRSGERDNFTAQCMERMLKLADQALYRAKEEGRNRCVVHRSS